MKKIATFTLMILLVGVLGGVSVGTASQEPQPESVAEPSQAAPVLFDDAATTRTANAGEVQLTAQDITLRPTKPIDNALIELGWLYSNLQDFSSPAPFQLERINNRTYANVSEAAILVGSSPAFVRSSEGGKGYSLGTDATVRLFERPMQITAKPIMSKPGDNLSLETPNGTVTIEGNVRLIALNITLEDGNHQGQTFAINRSWLATYNISRPILQHEDGSFVPFDVTATHIIAHPSHFSSITIREDDDSWETWYKVDNYSDDVAVKRLTLTASQLNAFQSAMIYFLARASVCDGPTLQSMRLLVNGVQKYTFNPCDMWTTDAPRWGGFGIGSGLQVGTNTIRIEKMSNLGWEDRNILIYMDQTNDLGHSDAVENGNDVSGEMMWYLVIQNSLPNAAPYACFAKTPSVGSTSTIFQADATCSSDAETPKSYLQVRWDWESDGIWDTSFSTTKTAYNAYASVGTKTISMQVRDDEQVISTTSSTVSVKVAPTPCFTITPDSPAAGESTTFNPTCSSDDTTSNQNLVMRWDWENDGYWDTAESSLGYVSHTFTYSGYYEPALEIKDLDGLRTSTTLLLWVYYNYRPSTCFSIDRFVASPATVVNYDLSCSTDDGTAFSNLEFRWDWENDGTYDTAWTTGATQALWTHQFPNTGNYNSALQARDHLIATYTTTRGIWIKANEQPQPCFRVSPAVGTKTTVFTADASCTSDDLSRPSEMKFRWDINDDGTWDTSYANSPTASWTYGVGGVTMRLKLEAQDGEGFASYAYQSITVVDSSAELPATPCQSLTLGAETDPTFYGVYCGSDVSVWEECSSKAGLQQGQSTVTSSRDCQIYPSNTYIPGATPDCLGILNAYKSGVPILFDDEGFVPWDWPSELPVLVAVKWTDYQTCQMEDPALDTEVPEPGLFAQELGANPDVVPPGSDMLPTVDEAELVQTGLLSTTTLKFVSLPAAQSSAQASNGCHRTAMQDGLYEIDQTFHIKYAFYCYANSHWNPPCCESGAIVASATAYALPLTQRDYLTLGWVKKSNHNGQQGDNLFDPAYAAETCDNCIDWPHGVIVQHELSHTFGADDKGRWCNEGWGIMNECWAYQKNTRYDADSKRKMSANIPR